MAKLDNEEIGQIVAREISDAINHYDSEFSSDRLKALDYYLGEPLGNEIEGKSQVISTEVADTVEQIMPSLMRVFTGSDKYVRFQPRNEEDAELAEQVSDYVNYIIAHDNDGYRIIDTWLRDALLFKLGVVKFYYDDTTTVEEAEYNDLNEAELAVLLDNPDVEVVSTSESLVSFDVEDDGQPREVLQGYNITVKVKKRSGRVKIENVPPEEFIFNRRAKSLDDARFICHRTTMSVSDLVSMGYDADEIEEFAGTAQVELEEERDVRFGDIGTGYEIPAADDSQRQVAVYDTVILLDADGDGISERRRILSIGDSGEHVLENKVTDYIPFAVLSPILMPHRLVGRSIFDLTKDLQVIKSTLMRQYLDATYLTVNPRTVAVEGQVNLDDLLDGTAGGIVRVRQPGAVQMLTGAGVGGEVQPLMRYIDEIKEQRTGMSKASMGLDSNALQSTTASAVAATVKGAGQKLESYCRTIAETGFRDLFRGILHLVTSYQQQERIVRLRNKFVPIDPREWDSEFDVVVNVGLGTADDEQRIAFLIQIAQKQEQILQQLGPNNPLCTLQQYSATLREIVEIGGFKDVGKFFNDPNMVQAAVAQQQQQSQQAQQPNPEMIKVQQDFELKKMKLEAELALKREEMQARLQMRREELALEAELRTAKAITDAEISTNLPRM
jgi:hypothetical protein